MENLEKPQRFRSVIVEALSQYREDLKNPAIEEYEAIDIVEAKIKTAVRHFINTAEEFNLQLRNNWVGDMR